MLSSIRDVYKTCGESLTENGSPTELYVARMQRQMLAFVIISLFLLNSNFLSGDLTSLLYPAYVPLGGAPSLGTTASAKTHR